MGGLSKNAKKELANVLNDTNEVVFVSNGQLYSLEVHETDSVYEISDDLAEEIQSYPELKESLQRFVDQPDMKRYTAKELKELRYEQRR